MKLIKCVLLITFFLNKASSQRSNSCNNPSQRALWTDLTSDEKSSYIAATKCLQTKPSITGLSPSKSLFDDFTAVHIRLDTDIHNVAAMLPWHSGFVYAREMHLRNCGFKGRLPGWNWTRQADLNDPFHDVIFDNTNGLGGNGNSRSNYAITSGPFARFQVDLIMQDSDIVFSSHLLKRQFSSEDDGQSLGYSNLRNSKTIGTLMKKKSYEDFR